jgi:hypothetical protein
MEGTRKEEQPIDIAQKSKTQTAIAQICQKKLQGGDPFSDYWSPHIFQATDLHDEISGYIKMRGEG